jgi:murein DD-endopeptidase MepM/ murein hydrolase activator NlpD
LCGGLRQGSLVFEDQAKVKEAAAKALESELKEKVSVLQSQIGVLKSQISEVQNSIGVKEQEITAKQNEIARKEQEIADQWDGFKSHMAAMQELRDGGSVAMLQSVNDLYELLTFNEVMQDISVKDTEILTNMRNAKEALENDKAQLEEQKTQLNSQRAELQSQKSELDSQNAQMKGKQSELNNSISAAKLSAAEAQAAQQKAQAAIESDELNYEAVKKEIQKLIAAASASKPQLSFSGFACPLKSYTRISSEYGWRKNPVTGVNKLHAGTDFAAPAGTPIYAAASGYVQVAGWSSGGYGNYVIIYHGKMSDGNQYSTLYGHMRSVATSAGKYVNQGDLIGYVGSTGNSTGNHLHLEVWKGGSKANAVNPRGYIPIR